MHQEQHQTVEAHLGAAGYLDQPGGQPQGHPTSDDRQPPQYFALRDEAFALRAEVGGDLHRAVVWRKKWLDQPQPVKDEYCFLAPDLVRNALAVNDVATARAALEACEAAEVPFPDGLLIGRCCRGLLDGDGGQLLLLAEECRRWFRWNLLAAMLEEVAAARLADTGDTTGARTAFNAAIACYDGLGATWNIRRASARLRPYGIRRGPRSVHRRAMTGWAALTPAEARVARLVARGLSNPDIARELVLSRNTVQTHVSSLLAKLALRSRIEVGPHIPPESDHQTTPAPTRGRGR
jgi:DNA-binding CsgD family transcriptional regulator